MKGFVLCVFPSFWKAADPRHHFNQDWRGYWWRHARCRLVIHIASMQANDLPTENVLDSTYAKKPGPLLKRIMTKALLKHKDYYTVYSGMIYIFFMAGVRNAESALIPSITTVLVKQVIWNNRWPGLCLYDLPTSLKGRDVVVPSQLEPLTLDPPKGD